MDALPKNNWSLKYQLSNGTYRKFPTLEDYIRYLVASDVIRDEDDLIKSRAELAADIQNDWIANSKQVGCAFAYKLVRNKKTNICLDKVFLDTENIESIGILTNIVIKLLGHFDAIHIILPTIKTPEQLCKFLSILCNGNNWALHKIEPMQGDSQHLVKVGLRFFLSKLNYESWVLGFAPFESMPITRRAPFTSIIFRTSEPGRCPHIMGADRPNNSELNIDAVHLADLPDGLPDEDSVRKIWDATQREKELLIAGSGMENYAKAKVTFSISSQFEDMLTLPTPFR